jgi:hypothetical protein
MPELLATVYPPGYADWFLQVLFFEMIGSGICVYLRLNLMVCFFEHKATKETKILK